MCIITYNSLAQRYNNIDEVIICVLINYLNSQNNYDYMNK